jgi:hypothetical protein
MADELDGRFAVSRVIGRICSDASRDAPRGIRQSGQQDQRDLFEGKVGRQATAATEWNRIDFLESPRDGIDPPKGQAGSVRNGAD